MLYYCYSRVDLWHLVLILSFPYLCCLFPTKMFIFQITTLSFPNIFFLAFYFEKWLMVSCWASRINVSNFATEKQISTTKITPTFAFKIKMITESFYTPSLYIIRCRLLIRYIRHLFLSLILHQSEMRNTPITTSSSIKNWCFLT